MQPKTKEAVPAGSTVIRAILPLPELRLCNLKFSARKTTELKYHWKTDHLLAP